jgi:hypothetical protein
MFEWIKNIFCFRVKPTFNPTTPLSPVVQEDTRSIEAIKRTRAAFRKQEFEMQARAAKAHASECNDMWTCVADPCFIREPDKIVSTSYAPPEEVDRYNEILKRNRKRLKKMTKVRIKQTS